MCVCGGGGAGIVKGNEGDVARGRGRTNFRGVGWGVKERWKGGGGGDKGRG